MLGHDWEPAEGTCIDIRIKGNYSDEEDNRRFLMEVRPSHGAPFRVELKVAGFHENFKGPDRGQVCMLKCDVKRQDAKWDLADPGLSWKTYRQAKASDFEAELHAKPWVNPPAAQQQTAGSASQPQDADPAARLASLKALHDTGALTSSEYELQRQKIIASI